MKNDENKKRFQFKLDRLNKSKKLNRLKKFNIIKNINSKKIFKSKNTLKPIKKTISYVSNKIDDLIVVNNENAKNNTKKNVIDKKNNENINNKITKVTTNYKYNNKINNKDNTLSLNGYDKNSKDLDYDFSYKIEKNLDEIEENFGDEYYRGIEPTKEEIKHENYLKSLDKNNLKNNKKNIFENSNDFHELSTGNDNFDRYLPKEIPKSEGLTNDPKNFRLKKSKSRISRPLSDKFGNVSKIEKEKNENLGFKDIINFDRNPIKIFKNKINNDEDSKTVFGAAIFGLVIIVILFSAYYFLFFQPYQEELSTAKTNKFNELNSLFKGPLALDSNVLIITSEIELAKSMEEINAIDIIRPATASWRDYQSKQINKTKDDFNRVMITYETANTNSESSTNGENIKVSKASFVFAESTNNLNNKSVIMDADDAKLFVNGNDANVLANIVFKKPDTVAVPILITRLQAGAGLISIGSIVDIYSLSDSNSQSSISSSSSVATDSNSANNDSNNYNDSSDESPNFQSSSKTFSNSPDISGSTILAIMRSKDSGVISADYIKSQTNITGNNTNQIENSQSFSTDVEEMIKGSISGGYNEEHISSLLNSYGLKLSDYERQSNLADIDVQYLILIEVPRGDVSYVINNMENIILTIPTNNAPTWMTAELKSTYSKS